MKNLFFIISFLISLQSFSQSFEALTYVNDSLTKIEDLKSNYSNLNNLNFDLKKVQLTYFSKGYLEFSVDSIVSLDSLKKKITISTGRKYRWKKIKWNIKNDIIRRADLNSKKLESSIFNPIQFYKGLNEILEFYENNGFPFVTIKMDSILIKNDSINGVLNLDLKEAITYDSIAVHGDAKIKTYFLEHYLGIKKGKIYNQSTISAIDKKLSELAFVTKKQNSNVEFHDNKAVVHVFINHKKAGFFNGVVGILPNQNTSPEQKALDNILITGDLQLILANIFKHGERIEFKWKRLQTETQRLNTSFSFPYLFKSSFGTEYKLDLLKQDTTFLNVKHKFGINYSLETRTQLKIFWSSNNTTQLSSKEISSSQINTVGSNSNTYGLEFSKDNRDYRFNPRKGYLFSISGQAGTKKINSNTTNGVAEIPIASKDSSIKLSLLIPELSVVYSIESQLDVYFPLFNITTIKVGFQGAYIINPYLFDSDLYRIGGFRKLRGFDEQSIYSSLYGVGTLEYRILFEKNSFFSVFYDQGYSAKSTILENTQDWPFGFGAGINFQTKPGIFSVSYAVGKQQNNPIDFRRAKIHFGFISLF